MGEARRVITRKKAHLHGVPFSCKTKRTGLEPATSAVTGLRSNQTELPLRRFYRCSALQRERGALYRCMGCNASLFFKKVIIWVKYGEIVKK